MNIGNIAAETSQLGYKNYQIRPFSPILGQKERALGALGQQDPLRPIPPVPLLALQHGE